MGISWVWLWWMGNERGNERGSLGDISRDGCWGKNGDREW